MGTKPKKLLIKISTIIALSLLLTFANTNVYAGITLPSGMENIYTTQDPVVESIGGQIIWVVQLIFYAAAVIIVMFAGLKYMGAAPEAKAEFKKKLIYMVVGAVILFAAGSLVRIIGGLALNNLNTL
mgnify:CR=1 FL=1